LPEINWAGFYFLEGDELIVGPFQGQPACVRIEMGKGVCGTAAATRTTQRVADVHAFEGHIACDPASRSEIVVPLIIDGHVIGVLDIDSPLANRFSGRGPGRHRSPGRCLRQIPGFNQLIGESARQPGAAAFRHR
jgi:L-methionine (R)-S-oxide reductase